MRPVTLRDNSGNGAAVKATRGTIELPRFSFALFNFLDELVVARIAAQGLKGGIVFDPAGPFRAGVEQAALKRIEGLVQIPELGVTAGSIVGGDRIVGLDREGARNPFGDTIRLSQLNQCLRTEFGGAAIVGM
ncbi:MAG: hypothetical protein DLM52_11485 [Chthoniobacterales bacterium]|nr:MAG: hypothetical protein DLM52_11485 [Chthoniobacterales bacterium]